MQTERRLLACVAESHCVPTQSSTPTNSDCAVLRSAVSASPKVQKSVAEDLALVTSVVKPSTALESLNDVVIAELLVKYDHWLEQHLDRSR